MYTKASQKYSYEKSSCLSITLTITKPREIFDTVLTIIAEWNKLSYKTKNLKKIIIYFTSSDKIYITYILKKY